jgi:hypothetical protein
MFILYENLIIIFSYFLFVQCINIGQIQNAYIVNSTTTNFQFNCATCICQCLTNLSSPCCYVNCFTNNNTCQMMIFPSTINPTIIIDHTSVVYKTKCSNSTNTNPNSIIGSIRPITSSTSP